MIFKNVTIYKENEIIEKGYIKFSNKILELGINTKEEAIDLNNHILIPGFIDIHIHGVKGVDTMDETKETYDIMTKELLKEGTTSFLATTMTETKEKINSTLNEINTYMANHNNEGSEILGIHLEGPFLSKDFIGAQRDDAIQKPSVSIFKEYEKSSNNNIKIVTLAPEEDKNFELIKYLDNKNIISSIGHSNASYEVIKEAIKYGLKSSTHCYNAMSKLHHRDIGAVGATLLHDELNAEIITDLVHVTKPAINLLLKNKPKDKVTFVTDSMRAKALKDGTYDLGGQDVIVKGKEARLKSNNALAGSVLKMNEAFYNGHKELNIKLEELINYTSANPAKLLNVFDKKGSIDLNKDADFLVLDKNFNIVKTICRGKIYELNS